MLNTIKIIGRAFLPKKLRVFLWNITPRFARVNTYLLKKNQRIEPLFAINEKYSIRTVSWDDLERIKQFESYRNLRKFPLKIPPRLQAGVWIGMAIIDSENDQIAYLSWVVKESIPYFEEFGIRMSSNQFLLKDGFCIPPYRHQGLHTRMEQERINFCIANGANEMFIQIHNSNKGGIKSVTENGYKLYQQNIVIQWPIFNVYRSLRAFLKFPFRRIVK